MGVVRDLSNAQAPYLGLYFIFNSKGSSLKEEKIYAIIYDGIVSILNFETLLCGNLCLCCSADSMVDSRQCCSSSLISSEDDCHRSDLSEYWKR